MDRKVKKQQEAGKLRSFKVEKRKILEAELDDLIKHDAWNSQYQKEAFELSMHKIRQAHGNDSPTIFDYNKPR